MRCECNGLLCYLLPLVAMVSRVLLCVKPSFGGCKKSQTNTCSSLHFVMVAINFVDAKMGLHARVPKNRAITK